MLTATLGLVTYIVRVRETETVLPHHILTGLISGRPQREPTGNLASYLLRAVSFSKCLHLSLMGFLGDTDLVAHVCSSARVSSFPCCYENSDSDKTQCDGRWRVARGHRKSPRSKGCKMRFQDGSILNVENSNSIPVFNSDMS